MATAGPILRAASSIVLAGNGMQDHERQRMRLPAVNPDRPRIRQNVSPDRPGMDRRPFLHRPRALTTTPQMR
jgi:hypothetical protein